MTASNRLVSLVDPMGFDAGICYDSGGNCYGADHPCDGATGIPGRPVWRNSGSWTPSRSPAVPVYQDTVYTAANDGSGAVTKITDAAEKRYTICLRRSNGELTELTDANGQCHRLHL